MKKTVLNAIDSVYIKKNYSLFQEKCGIDLNFSDEISEITKKFAYDVVEENLELNPSLTWYIEFTPFNKGEFKAVYKTILSISKIAPLFYVQHEFEIENIDMDRMTPVLDGFGAEPYNKSQAELYNSLFKFLYDNGYEELSYSEMNEVVLNVSMPEGVNVFGPQMTVENCLFRDILGICELE